MEWLKEIERERERVFNNIINKKHKSIEIVIIYNRYQNRARSL